MQEAIAPRHRVSGADPLLDGKKWASLYCQFLLAVQRQTWKNSIQEKKYYRRREMTEKLSLHHQTSNGYTSFSFFWDSSYPMDLTLWYSSSGLPNSPFPPPSPPYFFTSPSRNHFGGGREIECWYSLTDATARPPPSSYPTDSPVHACITWCRAEMSLHSLLEDRLHHKPVRKTRGYCRKIRREKTISASVASHRSLFFLSAQLSASTEEKKRGA